MKCTLWKGQYTCKSETAFNIMLNNHRNSVYKTNTPEADQHFRLPVHSYSQHAKFTLIEQLNDTELDRELLTFRLKKCEELSSHMDLMLNLISLTPKISAFLVQICLRRLYAEQKSL